MDEILKQLVARFRAGDTDAAGPIADRMEEVGHPNAAKAHDCVRSIRGRTIFRSIAASILLSLAEE